MGVAPTEYRPHEACIEVSIRFIKWAWHLLNIYQEHEGCIEVATRSMAVYKVDVAPIEYRAYEACIEIARRSTTVYKVGAAYIGRVLPCTYLLYL